MFIKTQEQNIEKALEKTSEQTGTHQLDKKLVDALALYVKSIKANEVQPEWIYANSIALSAQLNHFDLGNQLIEKAEKIYPKNEEITRAIALFYEKQDLLQEGIDYYQQAIDINPLQPEWVYIKVHNFLLQNNLLEEAAELKKKGLQYFPQSSELQLTKTTNLVTKKDEKDSSTFASLIAKNIRSTPQNVEHNVELNVSEIRRQLMDSSIIEKYEIILEQILYHGDQTRKKMDTNALLYCLAEIKTDIHYLKTKLLDSPVAAVDPQAQPRVDLEEIVSSIKPIPLRCELKHRIVGSGWHGAEKHGRWTGSGTLSSLVLPYPTAGEYRLEITVRAEAKPGLLNTLKINLNDQPISTKIGAENHCFPSLIQEKVVISEQPQSFLTIDLMIDETIKPQASDTRLIGLLIEQISLIPLT